MVNFEQTRPGPPDSIVAMYTSVKCRKIAQAKIAKAERLDDERRANRLISAAKAWLILARGMRSLEIKKASQARRSG